MGKCAIIRFAACAAFVFAASETLQAAELTHRWSFNGDWADSAGGTVYSFTTLGAMSPCLFLVAASMGL